MKRIMIWLAVLAVVLGCLTGCKGGEAAVTTEPALLPTQTSMPQETAPQQTPPQTSQPQALALDVDSYWFATDWYSPDTGEADTLQPELWSMDLYLGADGTARFRDIYEGVQLLDDSFLKLSWEPGSDGTLRFYNPLYSGPVLEAVWSGDRLLLDYFGLQVTLEQRELPRTPGEKFVPAELVGTWLQVSGETEGWVWEAMPAHLNSLILRVDSFVGPLVLAADAEERDYYGNLEYSAYRKPVTVLEEPLYPGCENDAWSVRIGEAAPVDENGVPLEPQTYATLLDHDTMLVQQVFTVDGALAVSTQTYWRFPELVSWMSPESMELDLSNWSCMEYRKADGLWGPPPEEMENFSLILEEDGSCWASFAEGTGMPGAWMLGTGGVVLLSGGEDDFWFGGALTGYRMEDSEVYEMSLYFNGGILKLRQSSYG